jgi:hypothetical protein
MARGVKLCLGEPAVLSQEWHSARSIATPLIALSHAIWTGIVHTAVLGSMIGHRNPRLRVGKMAIAFCPACEEPIQLTVRPKVGQRINYRTA